MANTERVLGILADADVRATFFVLTWNVERHPELPRMIADAGHEVASHGHAHGLAYDIGERAFRRDVERSKKLLEDATGTPVLGYRAPSFSITKRSLWALDVLVDLGFRYDSSIFPVHDPLYGIPGSQRFPFAIDRNGRPLIEFPISTVRLAGRNLPVGGGAYLRLAPYGYTRWGLRRLESGGHRAIIYIHPWELDPGQPRLRARGKRGFSTHYYRLNTTEEKLRRLFSEFQFTTVAQALGLGDAHMTVAATQCVYSS